MKKFRITPPVAALLLGVSTRAFTAAEKPTLVTYRYNLSSTAPGDIVSGGNYVSGSSTSCNGGKSLSNMVSDLSFESGLTGIGWQSNGHISVHLSDFLFNLCM